MYKSLTVFELGLIIIDISSVLIFYDSIVQWFNSTMDQDQ